jgi:hypothetical protein
MKTQEEEDREAFENLEELARSPKRTFAESMRRMAEQPIRPYKIWMTREAWEALENSFKGP